MTEQNNPHPACFVDKRGRNWPLSINVLQARKIKNELGLDLLNFFVDEKTESTITNDPFVLLGVFYILSGASEKNVTEDDFLSAFDGETVDAAQAALMEALINFSPTRQAQALRLLVDKGRAVQEKKVELVMEKIKTAEFGN